MRRFLGAAAAFFLRRFLGAAAAFFLRRRFGAADAAFLRRFFGAAAAAFFLRRFGAAAAFLRLRTATFPPGEFVFLVFRKRACKSFHKKRIILQKNSNFVNRVVIK